MRIILEKDDLIVESVEVQKEEKSPFVDGRDVILDIYAVDSKGKHYDIEIQQSDSGASRERARFYSSVIDSRMLKKGEDFTKMNDSYVIFITKNDVMGMGLPIYHVDRVIKEIDGEDFNDGSHIIYVNGSYRGNSPIGLLMKDFSAAIRDEMHYKVLKEDMERLKNTDTGRLAMCRKLEEYGDEREKYGREEGREEGKSETRIENAKKMIADNLPLDKVAAYSGLSLSLVKELAC